MFKTWARLSVIPLFALTIGAASPAGAGEWGLPTVEADQTEEIILLAGGKGKGKVRKERREVRRERRDRREVRRGRSDDRRELREERRQARQEREEREERRRAREERQEQAARHDAESGDLEAGRWERDPNVSDEEYTDARRKFDERMERRDRWEEKFRENHEHLWDRHGERWEARHDSWRDQQRRVYERRTGDILDDDEAADLAQETWTPPVEEEHPVRMTTDPVVEEHPVRMGAEVPVRNTR